MDQKFYVSALVVGVIFIGILYYIRISISMSLLRQRREKELLLSLYEKETKLFILDEQLIPRMLLSYWRIIQDQSCLIRTMLGDPTFAKNHPDAVDAIATSYANAKAHIACLLKSSHQRCSDQNYLNRLLKVAGVAWKIVTTSCYNCTNSHEERFSWTLLTLTKMP